MFRTDVTLGRTGITVPKNGFGALPIQRIGREEAAHLLRKAYDGGIRFFDTARFYTDSEEKIGYALSDVRASLYIASKTMAVNPTDFAAQLTATLANLRTDYLDLYQFHNPSFCPKPGDGTGLYEAMLAAKAEGRIRHIGITAHRVAIAEEAVASGLYDTLQYPFSYLATDREITLAHAAEAAGVGFIAMKALSGGLLQNARVAYAWMLQFPNVLPIWGIQRESELMEFLSFAKQTPELDAEAQEVIRHDCEELAGQFCRGCGYCLPCPTGIEISNAARMSLMIRRAPLSIYMSEDWQQKMNTIDGCIDCGQCESRCPYGLKTRELLRNNLADYREQIVLHKSQTGGIG